MSLKLFRSTEFAESRNFSPQVQRRALHPGWLVASAAAWITLAGNSVFWHHLVQTHDTGVASLGWLMLRIAVLIGSASFALLTVCMWRRVLRPATVAVLLLTALGSNAVAGLPFISSWRSILIVLILAIGPAIWIWRIPLRRLAPGATLVQVCSGLAVACAVFALAMVLSFKDLARLGQKLPEWQDQISPYNLTGAVRRLEQILLVRQQGGTK